MTTITEREAALETARGWIKYAECFPNHKDMEKQNNLQMARQLLATHEELTLVGNSVVTSMEAHEATFKELKAAEAQAALYRKALEHELEWWRRELEMVVSDNGDWPDGYEIVCKEHTNNLLAALAVRGEKDGE